MMTCLVELVKVRIAVRQQKLGSTDSVYILSQESDGSTSEDVFQPDSSQPTAEMSKGEARDLAVLGEIKLSLLYSRQDESLRLIIIKAEDLGKHVPTTPHINSFIKVCMLPHKSHRHESLLVRGTRNPHYNQEFTLKNISISNLKEYHLRLRVCNRIASRKYETLGEVILPLQTLGLEHEEEVRMWRDLDPKSMYQVRYDRCTSHIICASTWSSNSVCFCVKTSKVKLLKSEQ